MHPPPHGMSWTIRNTSVPRKSKLRLEKRSNSTLTFSKTADKWGPSASEAAALAALLRVIGAHFTFSMYFRAKEQTLENTAKKRGSARTCSMI